MGICNLKRCVSPILMPLYKSLQSLSTMLPGKMVLSRSSTSIFGLRASLIAAGDYLALRHPSSTVRRDAYSQRQATFAIHI